MAETTDTRSLERLLPAGCKMDHHSKYASDETCEVCGLGEGDACQAYEDRAALRRTQSDVQDGKEGVVDAALALSTPAPVSELREALREMVYETTHLSPCEDDGSHRCRITGPTLAKARAALRPTPKDTTNG